MKHSPILLTALMVGLALSGCLGDDATGPSEADPASAPATTSTDDARGNATTTPDPPEAAFSVLVDGNATDPVDGTIEAAAGANLTLDASASTGDNLSFAWELGDGDSATGDVVTHSYSAVGNYTLVLTVADSAGQTDAAELVVRVVDAAGAAGGTVEESFSGTVLVGTQGLDGCGLTGIVDVETHTWTILSPVQRFEIVMSVGTTALDLDLFLLAPDGSEVGRSTDFNPLSGPTETIDASGAFPAGDYVIEVMGCTAAAGDYDIEALAELA